MPSRALQTWQMKLDSRATNLIRRFSQNPNSRSRCVSLRAGLKLLDADLSPGLHPAQGTNLGAGTAPFQQDQG